MPPRGVENHSMAAIQGFSIEVGGLPSSATVRAASGDLAAAAKAVFDAWDQDFEGYDEELGSGGICQDVASAMVAALSSAGVENAMTFHASVGENHVFVVALLEDGVFTIDIPPHVYETGSGYVWKKRHDAAFTPDSVVIDRIGEPMDAQAFEEAYGD